MLLIAICDDQLGYVEQIAGLIGQEAELKDGYQLTCFASGEELLADYADGGRFDIIFLDVEMGQLSGLEVATDIRTQDKKAMIVFISAYGQYMGQAFDVEAKNYLTKPIEPEQFSRVLRKCYNQYHEAKQELILQVKNDQNHDELVVVKITDIVYISSHRKWLTICTQDQQCHQTKEKITDMAQILKPQGFFQTHVSHLINLRYLTIITKIEAVLTYSADRIEVKIPLARRKEQELKEALLHYKLKGVSRQ